MRAALLAGLLCLIGTAARPQEVEALRMLLPVGGMVREMPGILAVPRGGPHPLVLLLPDEAGMDGRLARLGTLLGAAGFATLEVDPQPVPADGGGAAAPEDARDLAQAAVAALELAANDPRIEPARIAAIGLGQGGRAALHAGAVAGEQRFRALAALYPGCAELAAEGFAAPEDVPALILAAGTEPADAGCGSLPPGPGRLLVEALPGASYAWDTPVAGTAAQPLPGRVALVRPDGEATAIADGMLLGFLRAAMGR